MLVKKKYTGKIRFCFDWRKLNVVTKYDTYPVPYISQILNYLQDARFISSIDLKKNFWQISLSEKSCKKTTFTVPGRGLFEFLVLPFGLHNSAQSLQRRLKRIFGPEIEGVFIYIDDIMIVKF